MLDILLTVNNFLHDFASGLWLASLLVLYLLVKYSKEANSGKVVARILQRIFNFIFVLLLTSLVIIILSGAIRLLTYDYYTTRVVTMTFGLTERTLLIGKHIFLLAFYGTGTWFAFRLRRKISQY